MSLHSAEKTSAKTQSQARPGATEILTPGTCSVAHPIGPRPLQRNIWCVRQTARHPVSVDPASVPRISNRRCLGDGTPMARSWRRRRRMRGKARKTGLLLTVPLQRSFDEVGMHDRKRHHSHAAF